MAIREALLARTFVEVADTLVRDFDVVELLSSLANRCVDLFDATEAGLMLADRDGGLQVVASSSRAMNHLELFELQNDEGPCIDCFRTGRFVASTRLSDDVSRWPRFVPEATAAGLNAAWALPLRLRETTIGSLNLLRSAPGILTEDDLVAAQALADVATIGLLQQRAAEDARFLSDQLETALDSRISIEQAKGVLAERADLSMDDGFNALREHSRDSNLRLNDVARAVANRDIEIIDRIAGAYS